MNTTNKNKYKQFRWLFQVLCLIAAIAVIQTVARAQNLSVGVSSREAYVGSPIVLQLQVKNAKNFEPPSFEVEGCKVKQVGIPSRSSSIRIVNGVRSESQSVIIQYSITPTHEGTFQVPAIKVNVNGEIQETPAFDFVATKSETGDLLFVEIEGAKETVYVGEPLDLKLKIWIKPYRHKNSKIVLSEKNMLNQISQNTSWGNFIDGLEKLQEEGKRPRGQKVLRKDSEGNQREYYLYEIPTTIYPKRPGKIDTTDLQLIVDYPTGLGRSRSPFDDFFNNSPLSRSSMMDDDFFGSPFGRGISVTSTRPIVAEVSVDSTKVLPVPEEGKPADYRGAVGSYRIITKALQNNVNAGDPIQLLIGIEGTGPMELVQAPPLNSISTITDDFKVTDQPLAGNVQGATKVFSTEIRPRREGIIQIPPIPFSFFDPEKAEYRTVYSQPISITVDAAEMLSLDEIVSNSAGASGSEGDGQTVAKEQIAKPNLDIVTSSNQLLAVDQKQSNSPSVWLALAALPGLVWIVVISIPCVRRLSNFVIELQGAEKLFGKEIDLAESKSDLSLALINYINRKSKDSCEDVTQALGVVRQSGDYKVANRLDTLFHKLEKDENLSVQSNEPVMISDLKQECRNIVAQLGDTFRSNNVMIGDRNRNKMSNPVKKLSKTGIAILMFFSLASFSYANETTDSKKLVSLSVQQKETLVQEANSKYLQAKKLLQSDQAEARELLTAAIQKYNTVNELGVSNSSLYYNLGNAYLLNGNIGQAIASFKRSLQYDSSNAEAQNNLEYAMTKITPIEAKESTVVEPGWKGVWTKTLSIVQQSSQVANSVLGNNTVLMLFSLSSLGLFGLLIAKATKHYQGSLWFALIPALFLFVTGVSVYYQLTALDQDSAIVTAKQLDIRNGDGEDFSLVQSVKQASGNEVTVISERGDWVLIETPAQTQGWVSRKSLELL